jgi:dipeptidyl aminopeptidase/acylaminoacyl peptidase
MKLRSVLLIASLWLLGLACSTQTSAPEQQTAENTTVTFKDRVIDLKPYVEGFPYRSFTPSYDAGRLFYMKTGEKTEMQMLELSGNPDLGQGKTISDIDYATRNVWGIRYNKNDGKLYWNGDERNDEVMNLTRLDPETGAVEKLTDVPYIFGWNWNENKEKVAFVVRQGTKTERRGELRILDLASGEETVILQDEPGMRFSWGWPSWQPEGKGLVLSALRDADRTYGNLLYVDLETKTARAITDAATGRNVSVYDKWLDQDRLLYFSNETGYRNAYVYNIATDETRQLTQFERDMGEGELVELDGKNYLFATTSNPIENDLYLIDPENGEIVNQQKVDFAVGVYDKKDNKMMVSITSNRSPFRIDEMTVSRDKFSFKNVIDLPKKLKTQTIHATPERVSFPTFDTDPKTGETRMLHGYLYKPENPLPKDQQMVMIQSFYGGGNRFSERTQVLAEAGIYVFSPSPRGSSGFGREFYTLNDKDLGGNEIIDIFYAAEFISEKLDIPPQRVGVYGGSHGGYATMRVLTFPGEINGTPASFDWGFGISHAGFSDIIHFYENCNIPDWVTLEAGDPATEAEKLRDRSPLYHADKMKGKLLLTHGTNDQRVPIAGSRMMADSLKKYDKAFTLVEYEGQGHGIKGLENTISNYQVWFDFLEKVDADL